MIVPLNRDELVICYTNAHKACVGGVSRIYSNAEQRSEKLLEDQLVGQIGNAAGCKWWYGNIDDYVLTRNRANENPTLGDNGSDLTGLNVDFKTSLMRRSSNPLDYKLLIRPKERHAGWIYVLVLVPHLKFEQFKCGLDVHIVGWAANSMLPEKPETFGVFNGAYMLPATKLYPALVRGTDTVLNQQIAAA